MSSEATQGTNDRARLYLQAYFDGQIEDESLKREIEERLATDPEFQSERRVLEALREKLRASEQPKAPPHLRNRIQTAIHDGFQEQTRRRARWPPKLWLAWAAAAAVLITLGGGVLMRVSKPDMATQLASFVDDHIARLQSGNPTLAAVEPRRLETWFRERLDYAPGLPRWDWAETVAGQIHFVDGRRAAQVHYRVGEEEGSLFVHPSTMPGMMESAGAVSPATGIIETIRGYRVVCWNRDGLDYIFVAQATADQVFENLQTEI